METSNQKENILVQYYTLTYQRYSKLGFWYFKDQYPSGAITSTSLLHYKYVLTSTK